MIAHFFSILFAIFIVVDPLGLVPLYLGLTAGMPKQQKRRIITQAVVISFVVLAVFNVLGRIVLKFLGIQPGAFYIAGGLLLLIVSFEMIVGRISNSKMSPRESVPGETENIAVFPLAIPMLAGPGTITTVILFNSSDHILSSTIMVFLALGITLASAWIILRSSDLIQRFFGRTGMSVVQRVIGLLLSSLAIQFIHDGIMKFGLL